VAGPHDFLPLLLTAACEALSATIGSPLAPGAFEAGEGQPPEGAHGVLPVDVLEGQRKIGRVELASPLYDLARLGRRMLGSEDPDKERELTAEDLDAAGQVLTQLGGAVEAALRSVRADLRGRPGRWWRSDEGGGEERFPSRDDRAHHRGAMLLSDQSSIALHVLHPAALLERCAAASTAAPVRTVVVMLGIPDALREGLSAALSSSGLEAKHQEPGAPETEEELAAARAILIGEQLEAPLQLVRRLRLADTTWTVPSVLCCANPSRSLVLDAIADGASHVLRVPCEPADLLRTLEPRKGSDRA
jgi:hypothetical protein